MVEQATPSETPAAYPNLVDRAIACIEEHDGAIDENLLVARVFGNTTSIALWRPLLRTVLKDHPVARLRSDGIWTTRTETRGTAFPSEFVVLDVETTGLKPSQQRIIEIGMIRVSPNGAPLRWTALLNPGRRIPDYVATLTGIDDQMVASAPDFRSIAPTILEIAEDLPIVGHNIAFDIGFLNAELVRCGLPKVVNTTIDTLTLANRFVGEARRLNLGDVARVLGVSAGQSHRALPDADMTLQVFREILARASADGLSSLDDLLRASAASQPARPARKPVGRGRAVLDRSHLASIPHAPGVYIMRDREDRVLYVGKAKDLRKRVSSYYSQPLGYTRKMDGLLETLAKIEYEVVGTELEALLLESQLIRRYQPRYNTVQRNVEGYVYVRVDISNPWPRVTTCRDRADDGARYFGPYRSASRAKQAVELVNDVLPLRTCRRSFTDKRSYGSPCIELSLKRCLGPCMGVADSEQYRALVHDVLDFFEGRGDRLITHLHARLEETVVSLDFERAAKLRDRIKRVEQLSQEQQRIDEAARHTHALLVLPSITPGSRDIWYLLKGRRWAQMTIENSIDLDTLEDRVDMIRARASAAGTTFEPGHHAVDEMAILSRWVRRNPNHPALISLDGAATVDACRAALSVDLTRSFDTDTRPDSESDDDGGTRYDSQE